VTKKHRQAKWLGRYESDGQWYKGQLHLHTTVSDGSLSVAETIRGYRNRGFDFICITDHSVSSQAAGQSTDDFLVLDGVEIDKMVRPREAVHTVCVGLKKPIGESLAYGRKLADARRQGAFIVRAHPYWSGNSVEGLECDFHAVEVYNDVCEKLNGKGCGLVHWERLLEKGHDVFAVAVDDAHWMRRGHAGFGWVMVRAAALTREAIMGALFAGEFYASCGPRIEAILRSGSELTVLTSPCESISLTGLGAFSVRHVADAGDTIASAVLDVGAMEARNSGSPYRLVARDGAGRFAWTNLLARP